MAEPVRAQTLLSVTLHCVRFQDGQLWKPRYPSLIRDCLLPTLQLEPAFRVCTSEPHQQVEVLFRIAACENAEFSTVDGKVSWQSLVPGNPPDVQVELVNENKRACRVLWTRSDVPVPLTVLRIACQPLSAPGPEAMSDNDRALMLVEGGVYLAIIDRAEVHQFPEPRRHSPQPGLPGRVRVVGIDSNSRPFYDLFEEIDALPEDLAPELAFRVSHGESAELPLALALPPGSPYADSHFKVEDGQVVMTYVFPEERPSQLVGTPATEENRLCTMKWKAPACTDLMNGTVCTQGRAFSLYAQLDPKPLQGTPLGAAMAWFSVDPTVIEPPACDASGVCTKPRDQMSRAATDEPAGETRGPRAAARTRAAGTRLGRRIRGRGRGGR